MRCAIHVRLTPSPSPSWSPSSGRAALFRTTTSSSLRSRVVRRVVRPRVVRRLAGRPVRRSDGGRGKIRPVQCRVECEEEDRDIVVDNKHGVASEVKAGPSIGRRMSELREAAGISLRELSRRSGVSVGYLSRLERDLQVPTTGLLEAIAEALEAELVDLLIDPDGGLRHRVIALTAKSSVDELEAVLRMLTSGRSESLALSTRIFPGPTGTVKPAKKRTSTTRVRRRRTKKVP